MFVARKINLKVLPLFKEKKLCSKIKWNDGIASKGLAIVGYPIILDDVVVIVEENHNNMEYTSPCVMSLRLFGTICL